MPVTDLQVAALRALVLRDTDENRRLIREIGDEGMRKGYFPLLAASFMLAARDRFRGMKGSDLINWVAEVRALRMSVAEELDPNVAEALLLEVFGKASTDDLDFDTDFGHQAILLSLLVEDLQLDDTGVDDLLGRARTFTDGAMS